MLLCQLTNIGGMPTTVVSCSYDRVHSRPSTACTEMLAWFRSQLMKGAWTGLHAESWKARGGFPESVADQKMVSQYMFVKWEAERNGQFSSSRYLPSPSFWMFHKEPRSLTCLLLPVGFVTEFDTLYQSVLFVVCFDNKTRGEVSYLIRLSSSVWRWIPKKCLDEWMDGWTKQKAQSSVRDWRTCLNNAQWWLT